MPIRQGYRYFLGVRPDPQWYPLFQQICEDLCLPCRLDRLHLTVCVVAETAARDPFVARRVRRALRDAELHSFAVNLSRIRAGRNGAVAHPSGRQDEIQDFYRMLTRLLRAGGMEPLHRKSGLHPHVTLSYRACHAKPPPIAIRWFPAELLLIESEVGLTKHTLLERWYLLPPRQSQLPFGNGPSDGRAAAGSRVRRLERVKGIEPSS